MYAARVRHAALLLLLGCSEFIDKDPVDTATPSADGGGTACDAPCAEPGLVECDGDSRRVCVSIEGCATWQPTTPCGDDEVCRGGECGADHCPAEGLAECRGDDGLERCGVGQRGFLDWGGYEACADEHACVDGACVAPGGSCPALGSRRCAGGGASVCKLIAGRLTWTEEGCGPGTRCLGAGICGADACEPGVQRCDGEAIAACTTDSSGFRVFGEAIACPDAGVCRDVAPAFGTPQAHCGTDECTEGALRCGDSPERCEVDVLGFFKWAPQPACADGLECRDGACGVDQCPALNAAECVSGGLRLCALAGGFLGWGEPAPCGEGAVCSGNACQIHGCPGLLATKCVDVTHAALCELDDATGLLAWSDPISCPGQGSECRAQGVCGKDACPVAGAVECINLSSIATCQLGTGPFLVWAPSGQCESSEECRAGVCGHDECALGAAECVGQDAARSCVDGASVGGTAGFGAWTPAVACPHPDMSCAGGACAFQGSFALAAGDGAPDVVALSDGFGVLTGGPLRWRQFGLDGLEKNAVALGPSSGQPRVVRGDGGTMGLWHRDGGLYAASLVPLGSAYPLPATFPLGTPALYDLFLSSEGPYAVRAEDTASGGRIAGSPLAGDGVLYTVEVAATDTPLLALAAAATASGAGAFAWVTSGDPSTVSFRRLDFAGGSVTQVAWLTGNSPLGGLALSGRDEGALLVLEREGQLEVTALDYDDTGLNGSFVLVGAGRDPVLVGDVLLYRVKAPDSEAFEIWVARVGPGGLISAPRLVDADQDLSQPRAAVLPDGRMVVVYLAASGPRAAYVEGL